MKLHRNIFTALLCAVLLLSAAACAKTPADGSSVISGGEAESDAASASGMSTTASDHRRVGKRHDCHRQGRQKHDRQKAERHHGRLFPRDRGNRRGDQGQG